MAVIRRHWKLTVLNVLLLAAGAAFLAHYLSSSPVAQGQAAPGVTGPTTQPASTQPSGTKSVQQVAMEEAERTGQHPERVSGLAAPPKKFDRAAFATNRTEYLNVPEPGRVWDTARPAEGVKFIKINGRIRKQEVQPGGKVKLSVIGEPDAPVTFTSFDGGQFENGLPTTTVVASAEGVADASLTASAGVFGRINIMAGSPLTIGHVRFEVNVADAAHPLPTTRSIRR